MREDIDTRWDDSAVLPERCFPDTDFVFRMMTRKTLETIDPKQGEEILDVGCGRGLDILEMASRKGRFTALDPSYVMIGIAKRHFCSRMVNALPVQGSAEHLPFKDGSFDKVYSKGAIDHFYNPFQALREMARVLKPGGRLIISVANFESLGCRGGKAIQTLLKLLKRPLSHPYFWETPDDHHFRFSLPFLQRLLPKDIKVDRVKGVSLFWGLPGWGPFLDMLPRGLCLGILKSFDILARVFPSASDVIILKGTKRSRI